MNSIKTFISYSDLDKKIATSIKICFSEFFNINCFLAHEDISPSEKWEDVIEENLKNSDLFVPVISKNSIKSEYVNQEIGYAYALNKLIIPIKIDSFNPNCFISKIQAIKLNEFNILEKISTIFLYLLIDNKSCLDKDCLVDGLIYAFSKSSSFKTSRIIISNILVIIEKNILKQSQIMRITHAVKNNNQIYNELYALPKLKLALKNIYNIDI